MWRGGFFLLGLAGCNNSGTFGPAVDLSAQGAHAARRTGEGGFVSVEILPTRRDGTAIPCDDGTLEVTVRIAGDDGHFADVPPQTWRVSCDDGRTGDLALVVDNSGSEDGYLDWLQDASGTMAGEVLDRGGRASVVRVSTNAEKLVELTGEHDALDGAIDGMWINDGWTALWDGVRMGNETLGAGVPPASEQTYDDLDSFCSTSRTLGVVAFTDGMENNSSDEMIAEYDQAEYPGDGLDTTYDSLLDLRVEGVRTPIYTIGLGDEVDADKLQELADLTGGRHLQIDAISQIPDVFHIVGDYFDASRQVCVELPSQECGSFTLRIETTWTSDAGVQTGTVDQEVNLPCESPSEGRVATILLTLGDPNISEQVARTLSTRTVEWVSPVLRPRVLVMLDDGNQGEDKGDAEVVSYLLGDSDNLDVTYALEPSGGITMDDLAGYDVLWWSNPGYPMDDFQTFETIRAASAAGKGVVLQGDDMTWSWGQGFSMSPLTHLSHVSNGTSACGKGIDNNAGGKYRVTFGTQDHPILRGLQGVQTLYGNDIDHSTAMGEGEEVLASATVSGQEDCMSPIPVVVVYDPP